MSKIDIDKLVAFEYKRQLQFTPSNAKNYLLMAFDKALKEQGLCYKDGEIIEIESKPANSFQISKDLQESDDERIRKESEDEKIRKELILFVKGNIQDEESEQRKDYLAWLEKHGEPNPFTGTGFKYNGHEYGMCARDGGVEITIDGNIADRVFSKDGKPIEWRVLDALIRRLEGEDIYVSPHLAAECLKSIKQRIKKGE